MEGDPILVDDDHNCSSSDNISSISGSFLGIADSSHKDDSTAHILSGRQEEIKALQDAWQGVCQHTTTATAPPSPQTFGATSAVVIVHGESGIGKSSLVDAALRHLVVQQNGFFCAGKFFQNGEEHSTTASTLLYQEPYSAIMAAFSDLCDIMEQSVDEARRKEIQRAMGSDGHLLTNAVSNILPFLHKQQYNDDGTSLDSSDGVDDDNAPSHLTATDERSLSKFRSACKTFLKAMASTAHPLVLFLDDIQWMDVGSQQLIQAFLEDFGLENVLVILAYRDEEADKVKPLLDVSSKRPFIDIPLQQLDSSAIYDIVCRETGDFSGMMRELSLLIEQRSEGNAFHIKAFLDVIHSEGLIIFDPARGAWQFDVDQIKDAVMIRSSAAEMLARKIELVDSTTTETLKVASVMGFHFSDAILFEAMLKLNLKNARFVSLAKPLGEAMELGFVETTKGGFKFTHDKIQFAFRSHVADGSEAEQIHLVLGQAILAHGEGYHANIFHAALHLNAAPSAIKSESDRIHLLRTNLRAVKYCMRRSAFAGASQLLRDAIGSLSPESRWTEPYFDLTFAMVELLAQTEFCIGNFQGCKEATREAILHAISIERMVPSFIVDVKVRYANYEVEEGIFCAIRALGVLGVKIPRHVRMPALLFKFIKVKRMLRKMSDEQIFELPVMEDTLASAAIEIMTLLCIACLIRDESNLAAFVALKSMELTLKHGLAPASPIAFTVYSLFEIACGNRDEAYRFGKVAQGMLSNRRCVKHVGIVVAMTTTSTTWRKEPLQQQIQQLIEAAEISLKAGTILGATLCASHATIFNVSTGANLLDAEDMLRKSWDCFAEFGQDRLLLWIKLPLQTVLNLQSHPSNWKDLIMLTGEVMNEGQLFQEARDAKMPSSISMAYSFKSILACDFGYFQEAVDFVVKAQQIWKTLKISYGWIFCCFAASFAHFELYRSFGKGSHLRKGRRYQRAMAKEGWDGAAPYLSFLAAFELSFTRKVATDIVTQAFDESIAVAEERCEYNVLGLLNEQAGFYLARKGFISEATRYFQCALNVYGEKWCSEAKYQWLQETIEQYSPLQTTQQPQIGRVIVCDLDD